MSGLGYSDKREEEEEGQGEGQGEEEEEEDDYMSDSFLAGCVSQDVRPGLKMVGTVLLLRLLAKWDFAN